MRMHVWPFYFENFKRSYSSYHPAKSVPIVLGKYFQLCACGWLLSPPSSKFINFAILRYPAAIAKSLLTLVPKRA